jgi:hypothetical protein
MDKPPPELSREEFEARLDESEARHEARQARFESEMRAGFSNLHIAFNQLHNAFNEFRGSVDTRFAELRGDMDKGFVELRHDMDKRSAGVDIALQQMRADMHQVHADISRWTLGSIITIIATILGAEFAFHQILRSPPSRPPSLPCRLRPRYKPCRRRPPLSS